MHHSQCKYQDLYKIDLGPPLYSLQGRRSYTLQIFQQHTAPKLQKPYILTSLVSRYAFYYSIIHEKTRLRTLLWQNVSKIHRFQNDRIRLNCIASMNLFHYYLCYSKTAQKLSRKFQYSSRNFALSSENFRAQLQNSYACCRIFELSAKLKR